MTSPRGATGRAPAVTLVLLSIFYAVGTVGHALPLTRPWMLLMTPWFLLLSGAAVVWAARGDDVRPLSLWFVPFLLVTFGLEVLGVATGAIFGEYHYTDVLGTLVLGVPPVIGWNWVLIVYGAHTAVRLFLPRLPGWTRALLVGLMAVGFDLLLEPVAIGLGYWAWAGAAVPLQNYLAWGLIAAAGALWADRVARLPASPLFAWYLVLQGVFFLVLNGTGWGR